MYLPRRFSTFTAILASIEAFSMLAYVWRQTCEAGTGQMRIAVKVLRLADGRPQDVGPLAPRAHIIERQCTDRFQQLRNQPGAFLHPAAIGGEPRIFTELLQVELLEEAQPLLVAGDANKQLTPILRRKHLLDRPRTLTRRHRRHLAAG